MSIVYANNKKILIIEDGDLKLSNECTDNVDIVLIPFSIIDEIRYSTYWCKLNSVNTKFLYY